MYFFIIKIIRYELLYAKPPFYAKTHKEIFLAVAKKDPEFPNDDYLSDACKLFILKLLTKNQKDRIGYENDEELLMDPWFNDMNMNDLCSNSIKAPIVPDLSSDLDVTNFNSKYTQESIIFSNLILIKNRT